MSLEEKFPRKSRDPRLRTFVNSRSAVSQAQLTTGPPGVQPTGRLGLCFITTQGFSNQGDRVTSPLPSPGAFGEVSRHFHGRGGEGAGRRGSPAGDRGADVEDAVKRATMPRTAPPQQSVSSPTCERHGDREPAAIRDLESKKQQRRAGFQF